MIDTTLLIIGAAFVAATALVLAISFLFGPKGESRLESRLQKLAKHETRSTEQANTPSVLAEPVEEKLSFVNQVIKRFPSFQRMVDQADVNMSPARILAIATGLAVACFAAGLILRFPVAVLLLLATLPAGLPFLWILWRRRRRLRLFAAQLPEALDMLARSLRAGQSLASGFNLVSREIPPPVGKEFGRVFEEQNLGIPLEESLRDLADRVPNLDLKFFATAVILQRQTGGDLAEILDRISNLIRERFTIWGQVQALTGEGRLSGIILMALPVVLFLAIYRLNPGYIMTLFTDPMGQQMLGVAIVMQILGALVIKKIVAIKV